MKIACINYQPITLYFRQGWSAQRLSRYYNPNGVATEVCVLARDDQNWDISSSVKVLGWRSLEELERKCREFKPDVIRCYEAFRPFCDYALLLGMRLDIPSYLSLHDPTVKYHPGLSEFTVITAYTETLAKRVAKQLNREVETQLNGIPSEIFRPRTPSLIDPRVAAAKYRIFTTVRKDPSKNIETLMESTEILSRNAGSVAHVICGPGTEGFAYDGLHIGLGPLQEQRVVDYLNWCNCYLHVEMISELSMAPCEALMVGRPVIVHGNARGNAQYIIDEKKGILIPTEKVKDARHIADALAACLSRKYDYAKIREWAIGKYDAKMLRQKEADRYASLLSKSATKYHKLAGRKLELSLMAWRVGLLNRR